MNPLLQVKDLSIFVKQHSMNRCIVKNLYLEIQKGECVGIVGESGSGKSLTAQTLACLGNYPFEGSIKINGECIQNKTEKEKKWLRSKLIGIIFQDPQICLNPTMRVGKQIQEVDSNHLTKEDVIELMQELGIAASCYNSYPHELSGGMCQRIMIAIALVKKPQLLIADEPTSALDVSIQAQILKLLKEIQVKRKTSILLITHDFNVVERMCSRILVMHAGEIVETGMTEQVIHYPQHPYTKTLVACRHQLKRDKCNANVAQHC